MRSSTALVAILVVFALLLPVAADALPVPLSDQLVISANERTPSEFPSFSGPVTVTITEFPGVVEDPISFPIGTRSGTHDASFNTAVALTEAGGGISDIIEFTIVSTNGVQTWTAQFISDSDRGSLTLPTNAFVVPVPETGVVQVISGDFLNSDGLTRMAPLFNVFVQSDVEVPEPSTLILLGSGLAGLTAGAVWRKRRQK